MSKVNRYRAQITEQMDILQEMMESNLHLTEPKKVLTYIEGISFKWTFISEEDREYIQCAQHAIEEGLEWNV